MAVLVGICAAAGALCIAAAGYRCGHRDGRAEGYHLADQWRDTAVAMMHGRTDQFEALRSASVANAQEAALWQRRAEQMGKMLRSLGYTVEEIEDPATGAVTCRATMTQPAAQLPLGPSMS